MVSFLEVPTGLDPQSEFFFFFFFFGGGGGGGVPIGSEPCMLDRP